MTKPTTPPVPEAIRRVLTVLDPTGPYQSVVDVATDLARRLRTGGLGLLLRDEASLGAAGLPRAREIQRVPAAIVSTTRAHAESQFRARARRIEALLAGPDRTGPPWTVTSAPAMTRAEVLRAFREGDLLVVAQESRPGTAYDRLAAHLLAEGPHPILMVPPAARPIRSVQAVYDESDAGRRLLALAGVLAASIGRPTVDVIVPGQEAAPNGPAALPDALGRHGVSATFLSQARLDPAAARRRLSTPPGLLLLPASLLAREGPSLAYALRTLGWPFLLVR